MKILILGGTQFIGRRLVESLIRYPDLEITLFNRGLTNPGIFKRLSRIKGDRQTKDLEKINKEKWDMIIDISCYFPGSLERIFDVLDYKLKKFIFISTCSVYDPDNLQELKDESAPIQECTDTQKTDQSGASYGARKAECERLIVQSGHPFVIFRPALVAGPYDHTDRFYYWLYQVKTQKRLLLPENGKNIFSVTYVDDLVHAIIESLSYKSRTGIYNLTSFPQLSIFEIINKAMSIIDRRPQLVHVTKEVLDKNGVNQWSDMPLWIHGDHFTYSNHKFLRSYDMKLTDMEVALEKTISYYDALGWPEPGYGLDNSRKEEIIDQVIAS